MVRFGSVWFFKVFLRTKNWTIGPVHRLWWTLNWTIGSVQNGPVLVLRASEPWTGPNMYFFFSVQSCILQYVQLGTVVAMCTYTLRSCGKLRRRVGRINKYPFAEYSHAWHYHYLQHYCPSTWWWTRDGKNVWRMQIRLIPVRLATSGTKLTFEIKCHYKHVISGRNRHPDAVVVPRDHSVQMWNLVGILARARVRGWSNSRPCQDYVAKRGTRLVVLLHWTRH
jgi:hypothetical protein